MSDKKYAKVVWVPEDVLTKAQELGIKMSKREAADFLEGAARQIQSDMIVRGWDSIETLLLMRKEK